MTISSPSPLLRLTSLLTRQALMLLFKNPKKCSIGAYWGVYGGINISALKFFFRLLSESLALYLEELSSKIEILLFVKIRLLLIYFLKLTKNPIKVSASTESEQRWIKYFPVENTDAIIGMDSLNYINIISTSSPSSTMNNFLLCLLKLLTLLHLLIHRLR